jgi:hypothetical protein
MRYSAIVATAVGAVVFALAYLFVQIHGFREILLTVSLLCIALTAVGAWDMIQPNHSLKRNYPILANIRFFLEKIRPAERVARFHHNTLAALGELVGVAGLAHPNELRPQHILKRMSASEVKSFAEVYKFLAPRELIAGTHDPHYAQQWAMADHRHFAAKPEMRTAA